MPSPLTARLQLHSGDPVTDEVRDEIGARLNDAFVRGDLDEDTYQRLLGLLFQGRTLGDLVPVAEALPAAATYNEPAIVAQPHASGPLEPARRGRSAAQIVVALGALAMLLVLLAVLLAL